MADGKEPVPPKHAALADEYGDLSEDPSDRYRRMTAGNPQSGQVKGIEILQNIHNLSALDPVGVLQVLATIKKDHDDNPTDARDLINARAVFWGIIGYVYRQLAAEQKRRSEKEGQDGKGSEGDEKDQTEEGDRDSRGFKKA